MQTDSPPSEVQLGARLRRLALPLLIVSICFTVFSPALEGEFVSYDDYFNFTENEGYRGLALENLKWIATHLDAHYQPITWLSHAIDYELWGMDPRGYHLVNLLLHCANAVLFYWLLLNLLPRAGALADARNKPQLGWAAAFGALVFAIHPLRVESVAWITERKDVLFLFFALASLIYYLRAQRQATTPTARTRAILASAALLALSLLSKAMSMTLPFLLLLLDAYPLGRLRRLADLPPLLREKIPLFVVMAAGIGLEIFAEIDAKNFDPESTYGLGDVLSQPAYRLSFYWWKTFIPADLIPIYIFPLERDPMALHFLLCAAGVAIVSATLLFFARRAPALLTTWIAFALLLAPVLGLVHNSYHFAADRNTYLASIAPSALVAGGLAWLWIRPRLRLAGAVSAILAVGVLATLGTLSHTQSKIWLNSTSLWKHTIAHDPENYIAQYNLGHVLADDGELDRAIDHYTRAIWSRDNFAMAWYNRALAWQKKGQRDRALSDFDRTIELEPEHWLALSNRGGLKLDLGQLEGAVSDLTRAIELQPQRPRLYTFRARALRQLGDEAGARSDLEKSRSLR